MRKLAMVLLLAAFGVGFLIATSIGGEAESTSKVTAPETATIDGGSGTKDPVVFAHKAHVDAGYKCKECHHTMKDENDLANTQKCFECHDKDPKFQAAEGQAMSGKKAFHGQCTGCHKKVKAETQKEIPTKCSECHPKKS